MSDDLVRLEDAQEQERAKPKGSQRDQLVACALACGAEFWHDSSGRSYVTFPQDGHREHHRIGSKTFRSWLARRFGERHPLYLAEVAVPASPSRNAMTEALDALEGLAWAGRAIEPATRLGSHAGRIYIDLGTPDWSAVEIGAAGWRIVPEPPLPFLRPEGMRPLPLPTQAGRIERLRQYLNVATDGDFKLVVGFMVGALAPAGPYPVLSINGEQGSSKSTVSKVVRRLLDPNEAETRSMPRNEHDLVIAAKNSRLIVLDNISYLNEHLSDAICRVATGAGFSTRRLYSDDEETLISVCRPQVINGIPDLASRADLGDRAVVVTLPAVDPKHRKSEAEFWKAFDEDAPALLGALLDAASCVLRRLDDVHLPTTPRMADFTRWVEAAAPALGWAPFEFLDAYEANRKDAMADSVDGDPFAEAIEKLVGASSWKGTATSLLRDLNTLAPDVARRSKKWPSDATRLSSQLRRIVPALRARDLDVVLDQRETSQRIIQISRRSASSSTAANAERCADAGEGAQRHAETLGFPRLSATHDANDAEISFFEEKEKQKAADFSSARPRRSVISVSSVHRGPDAAETLPSSAERWTNAADEDPFDEEVF